VAAQRRTPGNLASMVLTAPVDEEMLVVVFSLWESPAAVRAFAGRRPERAVYFPEDRRYLLELEPEVTHYEVGACEMVEARI
jgi:heme-degrading monooxygenase HmoA